MSGPVVCSLSIVNPRVLEEEEFAKEIEKCIRLASPPQSTDLAADCRSRLSSGEVSTGSSDASAVSYSRPGKRKLNEL